MRGKAVDARQQVVVVQIQTFGDGAEVIIFQGFSRQDERVGGVVVDNHPAVAVQDFAARRRDGQGFDAVPVGLLVIHLRILDLKGPKPGNQEQEDGYGGVLEDGDLAGGELDILAAKPAERESAPGLEIRGDDRRVHSEFAYSV